MRARRRCAVLALAAVVALLVPKAIASDASSASEGDRTALAVAAASAAALGVAVTVVPTYHAVHMLLAEPGQAAYCQLWGC